MRLFFSAIFLALLGMLYWSLLLVEEDLKTIKTSLNEIKTELALNPRALSPVEGNKEAKARPHIDPNLPNLLIEDPFYQEVLPKLLPPHFKAAGIRKMATVGKPDSLHPFSNFLETATWRRWCSTSVANGRFGFFEQFTPGAALKIEERRNGDEVEYWVHLREGMFWQPLEQDWFPSSIKLAPHFLKKHPLTAFDFKLFYDVVMNPFVSSPLAVQSRDIFEDILEFRILDDLTFVVKWKTNPVTKLPRYMAKFAIMGLSPLASFVYLYYPDGKKILEEESPDIYRKNSTFAETLTEHWAKNVIPSCGPIRFKGMSDRMIRFARNDEYYDPLACLVEGIEVELKSALENVWQTFKQGELDAYNLQPDQFLEFNNFLKSPFYAAQKNKELEIHKLDYIFRAFHYIGWNNARPLFQSKKVRRALTQLIDRNRIIKQILNGMGIEMSSPFYPFSDSYNRSIQPWPYDPAAAKRLLEEEGFFDLNGDGIIEKTVEGKTLNFEFNLTYFVKNPMTKSICEYISTALKEAGIRCTLNGVDSADISSLFDDKNFDAYYLAWALGDPPENLREIWHSAGAKEKGSPNSIGFANPEVDQIIDQLDFEYDREKRIALYHRFGEIFHEECPYTLLYTPKIAMLYRDYLKNVFLPVDRQDLVPGAQSAEPDPSIYWIKK